MSGTRMRSSPPARTTRRARAELQSRAARRRHEAPPGVLQRAARFLAAPGPDTRTIAGPARWRPFAALALSVVGVGISSYLTAAHFSGAQLACSDSGLVNCEKVTTSAESYFIGVPVALWGLLFYVAMTLLNLPVAWRSADRRIHVLRLVMVVVGICFVLYLVSAELLIIKNICLWCTSVHAVTFLLFVLVVVTVPKMLGWGTTSPSRDWTD
jgi:uncharacterized membrane protein